LFVLFVFDTVVPVEVVIEVDHGRERDTVLELYALEGAVVKSEPVEHDRKDLWAFYKLDALLSVNFLITDFAEVRVRALKYFRLDVVLKGHLDRRIEHAGAELIADRQRQVLEAVVLD
jgi:hypothetical protein